MKSRYIPEEIIREEILALLPVKSLLRFKSVSKAWFRLIESEGFIKTHMKLSAENKLARRGIICGCAKVLHLVSGECLTLEKEINRLNLEDASVVGCCKGLVCFHSRKRGRLFVWNPWTRVSRELPIPNIGDEVNLDSSCYAYGFGWDESSCAYKVCWYSWNKFRVYSSKTNSWKAMEFNGKIYKEGKFVSGKVYWREERDKGKIVWFDLKSEVFGVMEHPLMSDGTSPHCSLFGEHEGCLCVLAVDRKGKEERVIQSLDVWIMVIKEGSEESLFQKVATIPLYFHFYGGYPFSFVGAPDGQIWLAYAKQSYYSTYVLSYLAYDLKHKRNLSYKPQIHKCDKFDSNHHHHLCIQSLVRP